MATRTCTECDNPVVGRALTCSDRCRQVRARRRARSGEATPVAAPAADALEAADQQELIEQVFRAELTPIVREAITEDVIKGIAAMAKMTETLVQSLVKDIQSSDAVARGRAQTLMAKYLFGQVTAEEGSKSAGLTINMPGVVTPGGDPSDSVPIDVRECERCGVASDDFEPGAPRCNKCQAELRADIEARMA